MFNNDEDDEVTEEEGQALSILEVELRLNLSSTVTGNISLRNVQ